MTIDSQDIQLVKHNARIGTQVAKELNNMLGILIWGGGGVE